jgi:hypothetical protein
MERRTVTTQHNTFLYLCRRCMENRWKSHSVIVPLNSIKSKRNPKGQSRIYNPETSVTFCTQDTELKRWSTRTPPKGGVNTGKQFLLLIRHPSCYLYSQVVSGTTAYKHIDMSSSYKQLVTDEPNIVLWGNRSGHHNMKLRTWRHITGKNSATLIPLKPREWAQQLVG